MTVVTLTDRPKSFRKRCVIELFLYVFDVVNRNQRFIDNEGHDDYTLHTCGVFF